MQPTVETSPPAAPSTRRSAGLVAAGVAVLVVLLGLAVLLWSSADRRYDDNVARFARAPSGCDTTLDFERAGTFTLYVETTGRLGSLGGDCDAAETYDRDPGDVPEVQLELRPTGGDPLELADIDEPTYDTGDHVGVARATVEVLEPGDHVLTVDGDGGPPFAVAVGGDPADGVALMRWGAAAAAIVGVVAAGALLVLAGRRPVPPPEPVAVSEPAWPTSPPGFPAPPPTTGASGPAWPTPIPGQPPLSGPAPDAGDGTATSPWGPPSA